YGLLDIGQDVRHYPHNILLEIFVELGLIGILLFLTLHLVIFWRNLNLLKKLPKSMGSFFYGILALNRVCELYNHNLYEFLSPKM
ncbi:MAG: hypothetical protein R3206_04410, partial [Salegentibacter mishustinae]|nr:hypothetical protein [Salegentibacter mishustinae]